MAQQALNRPAFFNGMQVQASDLQTQQSYLNALRRRYGLGLHGAGVAWGMDVHAKYRSVSVSQGLAISPSGDTILIDQPLAKPVPDTAYGQVDLFVGLQKAPVGLDTTSLGYGYDAFSYTADLLYAQRGSSVPSDMVFLASVTIGSQGQVTTIDPSARQYCALSAGALVMASAPDGETCLRAELCPTQEDLPLNIQTQALFFDGAMDVAGGLQVRQAQTARLAELDVSGSGHLASFIDQDNNTLLDIDTNGRSWLGPNPSEQRSARLSIEGRVQMDANRSIQFASDIKISWRNPSPSTDTALNLEAGALAFTTPYGFEIQAGGASNSAVITPEGEVGLSLSTPEAALDVNGAIQSLKGGFMMGDDYVQQTAANSTSVMIGAIIDWLPPSQGASVPEGYAICNGQTISDSQSPLNGVTLPDLDGYFLLGAASPGDIGLVYDNPKHDHALSDTKAHTHTVQHTHNLSGHTDDGNDDGDSDSSDDVCSARHHTHFIDVQIGASSPTACEPNTPSDTSDTTDAVEISPPSMTFVKLMRIK